jgi:hypothetical protein
MLLALRLPLDHVDSMVSPGGDARTGPSSLVAAAGAAHDIGGTT